jgi:hypothetical protein
MRVAVTGTACVGKSTFIKDFLKNWEGVYTAPEKSYRDILADKKLPHSMQTTKETQQAILDSMTDEHMKYTRDDCVIFDRCPVDNLAYSIYAYDNNSSDIDEEFIGDCIPIVKEIMSFVDIIFYIPYDSTVKIEDNGLRETDEKFITSVDNILKQVEEQSHQPTSVFFNTTDRPVVIQLQGSPVERIKQASLYITDQGDSYSEEDCDIDWEELAEFGLRPEDVFPGGRL